MSIACVDAARAEALFVSALPTGSRPAPTEVSAAIRKVIRSYGSVACRVMAAGEYGEYPETAVPRMRWAIAVVQRSYAVATRP